MEKEAGIVRLLRQTMGHIASPASPTATSVTSARGQTLAQRRRRPGRFIIPRIGPRSRTTTRLASQVNVPQSKGLNIVI